MRARQSICSSMLFGSNLMASLDSRVLIRTKHRESTASFLPAGVTGYEFELRTSLARRAAAFSGDGRPVAARCYHSVEAKEDEMARRPQHGPRRESTTGRRPLPIGQKILDRRSERRGTIEESACQYAHPKADPVYNYLVRWEDGQVQAFTEFALDGSHGLELAD